MKPEAFQNDNEIHDKTTKNSKDNFIPTEKNRSEKISSINFAYRITIAHTLSQKGTPMKNGRVEKVTFIVC